MHTRHSVRWLSSVAALSAGLIGLGVPLAGPAAAAASITATAVQPRYAANATATIAVTTSATTAPANLTMAVIGGIDTGNATNCVSVNSPTNTQFNCTFTNTHGTGTDTFQVADSTPQPTQSPTGTVSFETIAAAAPQAFYGTGEVVSIPVQVTGGGSTQQIAGSIAVNSADATAVSPTAVSCQNNSGGSFTCSYTNNGNTGADTITIFDDDNPNGTAGRPDPGEPTVATALTVNFEKITVTPDFSRSTSTSDVLSVTVANPRPAGPNIHEKIITGPNDATAGCAGGGTTWTCTVTNNGHSDNPTIEVYDDLNGDNIPQATEPSATTTFAFETISVSDPNAGSHAPGTSATVNVSLSGVPAGATPSVDYTVTAGPDTTATPTLCQGGGTAWTCTIHNGGTAGADTLMIFDDANNNGAYTSGEPTTNFDVTFGSSVTATPASANYSAGDTATIAAHVVAPSTEVPHVRWTVTNGPDADAGTPPSGTHSAVVCTPLNGGTTDWTCTVPNTKGAGLDTVVVYDDKNFQQFGSNETAAQAAFVNTDPSAVVKANFQSASAITLTALLAHGQSTAAIATGGCMAYAVDVSPALTYPITVTATQVLGAGTGGLGGIGGTAPAAALSSCTPPGGNSVTTASNSVGNTGSLLSPSYTEVLTLNGNTGQTSTSPGRLIFGIKSTKTGTVTVNAKTGSLTTPNQSFSVITGGQAAVRTLTITPATQSVMTNSSATFGVLAQDANGVPLPGVAIDYVVAAGSPDAKTAVTCPATDQNGSTTCTLAVGGTTGIDSVTAFAPQTTGETTAAANDPQAKTTVTVTSAVPAGSHLSLVCADQLATDVNAPVTNCTVSAGSGGQQSVAFAAHVSDPSGVPLAGVPVQFALISGPVSATSTTGTVSTNANGNALYVVSETNPANNDKVTVQATVGNPAAGGLGPVTASATFQTPRPVSIVLTPAAQQVAKGGTAHLTAKVLDQFGTGVAGQAINFTVSGRNSTSGTATTGSNGAINFTYNDANGAGTDTVTASDVSANAPVSNNSAQASVTFGGGGGGGGGCRSNCTGAEHPTLRVTQSALGGGRTRISLVVISHPSLVNATVTFFQIRNGVRHKIGTGHTGGRGNVTGTLRARSGQHLKFVAKVSGKAGVSGGFSNTVGVRVR